MFARLISNQGLLRINHPKQRLTLFSTSQKTPPTKNMGIRIISRLGERADKSDPRVSLGAIQTDAKTD